jgi:hypothetical protein
VGVERRDRGRGGPRHCGGSSGAGVPARVEIAEK